MTFTEQYTRTHQVFKEYAARLRVVVPFDVRVLLAIFEHDPIRGIATYDELYAAIGDPGTQVRRAVLALRTAGLVRIERAGGGPGPGRGVGSQARLTDPGRRLARMIVVDCQERGEIAA